MSYAEENPALRLSACSRQRGLREQQATQMKGMYLFISSSLLTGEIPSRRPQDPSVLAPAPVCSLWGQPVPAAMPRFGVWYPSP